MMTLKDTLDNAKSKAAIEGHSVLIYDTGNDFLMILDGETPGEGTLSYIVHPDGSIDMVDG